MMIIKFSPGEKIASWNSTFNLDTAISVAPRLFFGHLILKQINLYHPVVFPLNNVPNVKSASMQNQKAGLFTEINHIFMFLSKDLSATIIYALVLVCLYINLSPD